MQPQLSTIKAVMKAFEKGNIKDELYIKTSKRAHRSFLGKEAEEFLEEMILEMESGLQCSARARMSDFRVK